MSFNTQPQRNFLQDPSLYFLLLSNLATVFFAIKDNWNLSTIMWIYWSQSVIIGIFNFIRILQLKEFSTEGFKINDQPAQPTQFTKTFTAFFFLFHYGFFHFGYMVFLITGIFTKAYGEVPDTTDVIFIFLTFFLFLLNHLFSYLYNRPRDTKTQNIGTLMFYPYARIIPMHLTIILGAAFSNALPLFLVLKTLADAVMHVVEHNVLRKSEMQVA